MKLNFLNIALIVTITALTIWVITLQKQKNGEEEDKKKFLDSLSVLHTIYKAELQKEGLLRDSLLKADKETMKRLAAVKKRDSIDRIRDINYLMKKNRALTDAQLDSTTKAIYEKVVHQ